MYKFYSDCKFRVILLLLLKGNFCGSTTTGADLALEQIAGIKDLSANLKENLAILEKNACNDYYEYVCGDSVQYKNIYKKPTKADYFRMEENLSSPNVDAEGKMKNFILSCKQATESSISEYIENMDLLNLNKNNWPILQLDWSETNFDLVSTLGEMKAVGIKALIKFEFDKDGNKYILEVSARSVKLPKNIAQISRILEMTGLKNVTEVVNDCIQFQNDYNAAVKEEYLETKIETDMKGLKADIPQLDWGKYVSTIIGHKLPDTFPVVIKDMDWLKGVISLTVNSKPRVVANYLYFTFINHLYKEIKTGDLIKKEKACLDDAFYYFDSVIYSRIKNTHYNDAKEQLYLDITKSVVSSLNDSLKIFNDDTIDGIMVKVKEILNKGFLASLSDDSIRKKYDGLEIDSKNYFKNSFDLYQLTMKTFYNEVVAATEQDQSLKIYDIKKFFSPEKFLINAFHKHGSISPVAFYVIGVPLLLKAIEEYRANNWYTYDIRDCFHKQLNVSQRSTSRYLKYIETAEIMVNAFNDWGNRNPEIVQKENDIFQIHELTSKKILYTLFMLHSCGESKKKNKVSRKLILAQFGNLNDFDLEYNCAIGSAMYQAVKCKFA